GRAGEAHGADGPESDRLARRPMRRADSYARAYIDDPADAGSILSDLLGALGDGADIRPPLFVDYGENIRVGARTFANFNLTALDVAPITIGEDCQFGPSVQLLTPTHPLEPQPRRDKLEAAEPITIGDNVWLGGGAI